MELRLIKYKNSTYKDIKIESIEYLEKGIINLILKDGNKIEMHYNEDYTNGINLSGDYLICLIQDNYNINVSK